MSNYQGLNKNSTISLSTQDNTTSLRAYTMKRADHNMKGIQKRLAGKIGKKESKIQARGKKDKRPINSLLKSNRSGDGSVGLGSSKKGKPLVLAYSRLVSPQKEDLRKQFNSIFEHNEPTQKGQKVPNSETDSQKNKVKALLSYRQKLNQNASSKKQVTTKSGNRSLNLRGIKSKDSLSRTKGRNRHPKLSRKKSLNDHLMTPLIKKHSELLHKNIKNGKIEDSKTYRLFYSPREIRSQFLNHSSSHNKNLGHFGTITDSFGNSKYFKKVNKKSPLFDLSKTMFSKKLDLKGSESNLHNRTLKNRKKSMSRNKSTQREIKSPYLFDSEILENPQPKKGLTHSGNLFDFAEGHSFYDSGENSFKEVKGQVNPHLFKEMDRFRKILMLKLQKNKRTLLQTSKTRGLS